MKIQGRKIDLGHPKRTVFGILFSICFAHFINDLIQGVIPSVYPLLKVNYGLSFLQIGLITFAYQFTASVLQPLIGHFTDKYPKPFLQVYGMFFPTLGIILLSYASEFYMIIGSCILIGLGSAIFHPESGRISNLSSGGKYGLAQSIFQLGGNSGTALAPLLIAIIVVPHTQRYILWFLIASVLGIIMLTIVANWYKNNLITKAEYKRKIKSSTRFSPARVRTAIIILLLIVFSKFIYSASLSSYYTFYLIDKFHVTIEQAQYHMFIYLFAYTLGTIIGGPLGDKFGRVSIIWFSVFGATPFALMLPYANLFYTDVLMVAIGLIMSSAFPAIIVYAQELMPRKLGMISGLFYGSAFGVAAIASALLGLMADKEGIRYVYQLCSYLPIIGAICYFLPNKSRSETTWRVKIKPKLSLIYTRFRNYN